MNGQKFFAFPQTPQFWWRHGPIIAEIRSPTPPTRHDSENFQVDPTRSVKFGGRETPKAACAIARSSPRHKLPSCESYSVIGSERMRCLPTSCFSYDSQTVRMERSVLNQRVSHCTFTFVARFHVLRAPWPIFQPSWRVCAPLRRKLPLPKGKITQMTALG